MDTETLADFDGLNNIVERARGRNLPQHVLNALEIAFAEVNSYRNLDHDLIKVLNDLKEEDNITCYTDRQYSEVANNLDNSYVIYFKNAGMFKVYDPDELNTLQNQLNTRRPLRNTNEIYEVVGKEQPQKIIIIIDGSIDNELNKIKDYVYTFFKGYNGELDKEKDVISYRNPVTNNLEILVNGIYANNYDDKKKAIETLLKYIEAEERKKGKISLDLDKINHHKYSDIPGADMFIIPEKRINVSTSLQSIFMQHVSTLQDCKPLSGGITINIHNDGVLAIGNDNVVSGSTTNVVKASKKDDIQAFVNYVKTNKPSWYKEGEYVTISDFHRQFLKITKSKITCSIFSKKCKDIFFSKSVNNTIDGVSARRIMLWKISDL